MSHKIFNLLAQLIDILLTAAGYSFIYNLLDWFGYFDILDSSVKINDHANLVDDEKDEKIKFVKKRSLESTDIVVMDYLFFAFFTLTPVIIKVVVYYYNQ